MGFDWSMQEIYNQRTKNISDSWFAEFETQLEGQAKEFSEREGKKNIFDTLLGETGEQIRGAKAYWTGDYVPHTMDLKANPFVKDSDTLLTSIKDSVDLHNKAIKEMGVDSTLNIIGDLAGKFGGPPGKVIQVGTDIAQVFTPGGRDLEDQAKDYGISSGLELLGRVPIGGESVKTLIDVLPDGTKVYSAHDLNLKDVVSDLTRGNFKGKGLQQLLSVIRNLKGGE